MKHNVRMRRLRSTKSIRDSLAEVSLKPSNFISPIFLVEGVKKKEPITSMPGIYHLSVDNSINEIDSLLELGVDKFLLFGTVSEDRKDTQGTEAYNKRGIVPTAIETLKDSFGDKITIFADVCLCPYTNHGHCGIPDIQTGQILNDKSLKYLAKAAVAYALSGADWIAPSDMMDHRVRVIREALDKEGLSSTAILSYSAKFMSGYYGPFREAVDSSPRFGDRSTYQMDYRDGRQAVREIILDEQEGADAVMVKPALAYLDIIHRVRQATLLPVAAYNVSGEYSMVKLGAKHGIFDEGKIVFENLTAIKRAGADWIITYHAKEALKKGWLE